MGHAVPRAPRQAGRLTRLPGTAAGTVLTPIACIWSSAASTSAGDAKYRSESAIPIVVFDSSIAAISATSIVTGRIPGNSVVPSKRRTQSP
jgi:hypothetical protein